MVGSGVPAAGACSGAGAVGGCPSPAAGGEGAGVVAVGAVAGCPSPAVGEGAGAAGAGVGLAGVGGDCGDGEGDVCANAPAQSDEIKKEVDTSNRGRNDTETPCPEVSELPRRRMHELAHATRQAGDVKVNSPNSHHLLRPTPSR
jgi:hypothetical protein